MWFVKRYSTKPKSRKYGWRCTPYIVVYSTSFPKMKLGRTYIVDKISDAMWTYKNVIDNFIF